MKTITPMKSFMTLATRDEQQMLADLVGTSVGHLYQLSGGFRQASADMAGKIDAATFVLHRQTGGRLPHVVRTDLCEACRACPYAQKALGERAVVSDFPLLAGGA